VVHHYADHSRGVHARIPINSGEMVLEVPLRCILTSKMARESLAQRKTASSRVELLGAQSCLAAYLLEERRKSRSFWRPYIDTLPLSFPNVPFFFDQGDLALLKGSFTLEMIEDRTRSLREDFESLRQSVSGFSHTHAEFAWAYAAVTSRNFGFKVQGRPVQALVPMADLLNHATPRETAWGFDNDSGTFRMTALKNFSPGDAVHDSYGRKCNSRFFLNYGFVMPDNPDNEAVITVPAPACDHPFYDSLTFLGGRSQGGICSFQVSMDLESAGPLLSFLRLLCADSEENVVLPGLAGPAISVPPISRRNERAALEALQHACTAALRGFDTTLGEDEELLKSPSLTTNQRNAIVVRQGEKRVLHHYLEMARIAIGFLRLSPTEFARVLDAPPASATPFLGYLTMLRALAPGVVCRPA
jgi:protein-histidine N-methyltransferase